MYAVIEDSGCQFKVGKGDTIRVDLRDLPDDADTIEFDKVLMIGGGDAPKIGQPYVEGAKVTADLIDEVNGQKVTIIKFRRRKNYRRKAGHKQPYLQIKVTDIVG
ncbi:MAG: 50S ribosomal protein L21 [Phycisphaera sp.]|nr:50S ribosomal protein L21 [Phycisphaera sp.]